MTIVTLGIATDEPIVGHLTWDGKLCPMRAVAFFGELAFAWWCPEHQVYYTTEKQEDQWQQ